MATYPDLELLKVHDVTTFMLSKYLDEDTDASDFNTCVTLSVFTGVLRNNIIVFDEAEGKCYTSRLNLMSTPAKSWTTPRWPHVHLLKGYERLITTAHVI